MTEKGEVVKKVEWIKYVWIECCLKGIVTPRLTDQHKLHTAFKTTKDLKHFPHKKGFILTHTYTF